MSRAIFRCDGSTAIGGGHLSRCLTLADALAEEGWSSRFFVNAEAPSVFPRLARSRHVLKYIPDEERHSAAGIEADLVVIDHYGLGADFERACRRNAMLVMAIDDTPLRAHDCDILLNQNAGASGSVSNVKLYLSGSTYALLAPGFLLAREDSLARRNHATNVQRIFISFGSSDPENLSGRAAQAIVDLGLSVTVDIAVSSVSPSAQSLRDLEANAGGRVHVHFDADDVPLLMSRADVALGAAGTTTWERCCLGLPSLVYVCADNQAEIATAVDAAGAAVVLGRSDTFDPAALTKALLEIVQQQGACRAMSGRAASLCDGKGTTRVVSAIASAVSAGGAPSAKAAGKRAR